MSHGSTFFVRCWCCWIILCAALESISAAGQTPTPTIKSLSPSSVSAGGSGFTLTIQGSNLEDCQKTCLEVNWSQSASQTMLPASGNPKGTTVTATVPTNLIAQGGSASVSVTGLNGTSNSLTFTITSPPPVISMLSPNAAYVGSSGFTLTVTGSGFVQGSAVQVNGTSQPTIFVNSQTLTTTIAAASLAAAGQLSIDVIQPGGVTSATVALPISYSTPAIYSLNPSQVPAGASVSVTINGTGFSSGSTVQINGGMAASAFVSATQITAMLPAGVVAAAGTVPLTVTNPGPAVSNSINLVVAGPAISTLGPSSASGGGAAVTLIVSGSNFINSSVVTWNSTALATSFVSATQLTASVGAPLIATTGTASVRVQNTSAAISAPVTFTITAKAPTITGITPNSATAGSGALTLAVNGTGFVNGSQVSWNGTSLGATFVSATQLTAPVPASLLAQPGSASVLVTNPDQSQSNTVTFTINPVGSVITALSPNSAIAGGAAFTLTVTGTGFVSGAVVEWGTNALTTTFVSTTQLTAAVQAAMIAQIGSVSVVVINPNKAQSNSATFSIGAAVQPTITSVNPASAGAGGAAFTLMVAGSGFVSGATVNWNGSGLPTTFVNTAQLTAAVSASLIANPGSVAVTVANPGGASSGTTFTITLPAPPSITFSGPATIGPAQQPSLSFAIGSPYLLPISGQVVLSFTPDAVNPADDPSIQFATGGRTMTFTIPANSTQVPSISIQTGTVSGAILAHMTLQAGGAEIPVSDVTMQIVRAAPVIRSVTFTQSTATLQVTVEGYATPREVTQAVFQFNPAPGSTVQIAGVTMDASSLFGPWFQSTNSTQYGSQFTYTQTLNVQGDVNQIGSIVVTLSNSAGSSQPATSN